MQIASGPVAAPGVSVVGVSFFAVEAAVTLIAASAVLLAPRFGSRWFAALESRAANFARHRQLSVLTVTLSVILLRLAMLPLLPVPQPYVHDEFSYLLGADTFASGRITNPTPALWTHFETFHVNMKPTYMTMYFPGTALVMAAGKVVFGHPWFGVLLASALMCGAICWMLQGWLPPVWALGGGLLAVLRFSLFSYWTNSYYGGALAALGGALVLGAFPRLRRRPSLAQGLALSAGMLILANTRPYEGFFLCAAVCALIAWQYRNRQTARFARTMLLPAILFAAGVGLMGYYNLRVFGSPLTLPYTLNRATYAKVPVFVWQKPTATPAYRHEVMRDFYVNEEVREFNRAQGLAGFLGSSVRKIGIVLGFFLGVTLLPVLFTLRRTLFDRRLRPLVLIGCLTTLVLSVNAWIFPHYVSPFAAGLWALVLQSLRHLRHAGSPRQPYGLALVRMTGLLCVLLAGLRLFAGPLGLRVDRHPTLWYGSEPAGLSRAAILRDLQSRPGSQLAIVRYAPGHASFDEWVYNEANIDAAKVIWARDMDAAANAELRRYYPNRVVWLVEPDANPPRVTPY